MRLWGAQLGSRHLFLSVAVCAAAGSILTAYWGRMSGDLGLIPRNQELVFGGLSQGEVVTAAFDLVNRDSEPVRITTVASECDCANLDYSTAAIAPGGNAILSVTWNIGSKRGKVSTGVTVYYSRHNNDRTYKVNLLLIGDVTPDFTYAPATVCFNAGSQDVASVSFAPEKLPDVRLRRARSTHPAFSVTVDKNSTVVHVKFERHLWHGATMTPAQIIVETNSVHEPDCVVPLVVQSD